MQLSLTHEMHVLEKTRVVYNLKNDFIKSRFKENNTSSTDIKVK